MYHKKNIDFAYLLCEDFVYQVEHKDAKKSNEMYYPRFTKVIIHFFMTKDPSIPKRNKVNWHYVRDDQMFMTIKLVLRRQNTQKFGAILPIKLTNEDIRNSVAYKEYYAVASGAAPPKTKSSVRKTQSKVAMTEAEHIKLATKKSLQQTHISQASVSGADEGTGILPGVLDDDDDQDTDNDGDDFVHPKLSIHEEDAKDEESFDPIIQTPEKSSDEGNDDANLGMNVGGKEGQDAEDDDEELYKDVNINLEGRDVQMTYVHTIQEFKDTHVNLTPVNPDGQQQSLSVSSQFVTSMLNPKPIACVDSLFESTPRVDVQASTTVAPLTLTTPTLPPPTIPTIYQVPQAPTPLTTVPSTFLHDLPNFGSLFGFDHRYEHVVMTRGSSGNSLLDQRMNEAVKVKVQVSKTLSKIEKTVNEQLEAEVLTRSSNSSKTSYAVAADLSELELKKILIEKMESNKSIHQLDQQRNLYKAMVDAYECDKIILDTYGDSVTFKRHCDDADKDEEPFVGSDRGSKRRRKEKELESTSAPKEMTTKTTRKSTEESKSHQKTASESAPAEEPMQTTQDLEEPSHQEFETDTLTPELLAGPAYELMKGSCKSLVELKFFLEEVYKATTDQLDWNSPDGQQYPHNLLKPLPLISKSRGHRVIPYDHFINNDLEYLCGGTSSRKLTNLTVEAKNVHKKHRHPTTCGRSSTSDRMLNDVRTALDDRLKGIQMKNLRQAI
nr:hypothetical protein [Tanacetum cinerariifolium]